MVSSTDLPPENPLSSRPALPVEDAALPAPALGLEKIDTAGRTPLEALILERLDDEKAQDIVYIGLAGQSSLADGLVIASGRSHRHVGAMADHLLRAIKDAGFGRARVEGVPSCDWVLIDVGDVIVHLFRPEVRSFYNIEKIWQVDSAHRAAAH